jgi:hypothetical protein
MSLAKSEAPEMPLVACVSAMEGAISVAIVQAIRSEPAIDTLMDLGVTAPTDAGHPTREGDAAASAGRCRRRSARCQRLDVGRCLVRRLHDVRRHG